ncbi:MAG: hypothetical protein ABSC01_02470 [Verrucomicrobiota bacterium]|jgi:hypothetical protein
MRIPDPVKKCVVFIGIKKPSDSNEKIIYLGTGFLVSITASIPNQSFVYLVTAKHVAVEIGEDDFYVRANSKDGKSVILRGGNNVKWSFHPNPDWPADVAVIQMIFPRDIFNTTLDYAAIPTNMFLTDEARSDEGIGEGDDVFTVGLFSHHTGSEKNIPIADPVSTSRLPRPRCRENAIRQRRSPRITGQPNAARISCCDFEYPNFGSVQNDATRHP